jgi:hypothetical protein
MIGHCGRAGRLQTKAETTDGLCAVGAPITLKSSAPTKSEEVPNPA